MFDNLFLNSPLTDCKYTIVSSIICSRLLATLSQLKS